MDEYEAIAKLIEGGKTPEQIVAEYGLDARQVRQSLALGRLAPEVREAWRKGDLEEEEAEAFTLEPDHVRQAAILKKVGKHTSRWQIRQAILGDNRSAEGLLKFVGVEAYKAAGGATTEDLFTDAKNPDVIATDIKLLTKLAEDKVKATIAKIEGEGWKWVSEMSDLPDSARWWTSQAKKDIPADKRGNFGVIIFRQHDGSVEFRYGVQKPSAAKAADTKKAKAKANGEVTISAALCGRIATQITSAAESVLAQDHKLGLAVIAAAIIAGDGPARIKSDAANEEDDYSTFDKALALMRKKDVPQLHAILAGHAAASLKLGSFNQSNLPLAEGNDDDRALLEALDQKKINTELRQHFDSADYFAGVTAQACKDAITACDPKQPITGKEKKSELAKLATDLVKKSNAGGKAGWLPLEMRLKSYDGPALKPSKAAAPAKKAAKKTAKKRAA